MLGLYILCFVDSLWGVARDDILKMYNSSHDLLSAMTEFLKSLEMLVLNVCCFK